MGLGNLLDGPEKIPAYKILHNKQETSNILAYDVLFISLKSESIVLNQDLLF